MGGGGASGLKKIFWGEGTLDFMQNETRKNEKCDKCLRIPGLEAERSYHF